MPWLKQRSLDAEWDRKLRRILEETGQELPQPKRRLPGDPAAMRGIPLQVRGGLGGAIKGTTPEAAVERALRHDEDS